MTRRICVVLVLCMLLAACGGKASGELPADIPAGYPLPAAGRVLKDSMKLGDQMSHSFVYKDGNVDDLAAELRRGLSAAGWPITFDRVEGSRHFVSTEKDGKIINATVFHTPDVTITVAVSAKKSEPAAPAP